MLNFPEKGLLDGISGIVADSLIKDVQNYPVEGSKLSCSGCTVRVKLTLRRLMSYIYTEQPFLMFLDHTQRRSTVGRTPLDE